MNWMQVVVAERDRNQTKTDTTDQQWLVNCVPVAPTILFFLEIREKMFGVNNRRGGNNGFVFCFIFAVCCDRSGDVHFRLHSQQ